MNSDKKYGFSAEKRIKKAKEFQYIQKFGTKLFSKQFLLIYTENNLEHSRLGLVVSKKVSKRAVKRNFIKRRLKEIFRLSQNEFIKPIDLVIIARKESLNLSYDEFERQILGTLKFKKLILK
ncbi:UNVERIFIED_CONTAM: hypothetical protein GTU68_033127 [Idotea baltica]|nr:hypothetical protein [Idotea baltica]